MDAIVGTAGHIDHGKTALVKALTGVDADRLPDEKRRGITIDIGFADMTVGDQHFSFVDVPGHERFVRNMLAGASGIDIVLLVVAADEGVMPQTREHFDICRLLDIGTGVIALTKSDLVDEETLEMARAEVAELVEGSFLSGADVIPVSSRTGAGLDDLGRAIADAAKGSRRRSDKLVKRLPIDRSFSVKGFGTVVTGTLASGEVRGNSWLELLPPGEAVRVRGIQVHGLSTDIARAGQRTALNLGGVDHTSTQRGLILVEPRTLRPTQILDTEIEVLKNAPRPLRSRQRVRVHIGTAELLARVQVLNQAGEAAPGDRAFVQLRLESAAVAIPGERFIIRSYSPQVTVAGGVVLDIGADRHRRRDLGSVTEFLAELKSALAEPTNLVRAFVEKSGKAGRTIDDLVAATGLRRDVVEAALRSDRIAELAGSYLTADSMAALKSDCVRAIEDLHRRDKLAAGMPRETLRSTVFAYLPEHIFDPAVNALVADGSIVLRNGMLSLAEHQTKLSPEETAFREHIIGALTASQLVVPRMADLTGEAAAASRLPASQADRLVKSMAESGDIVRVTDEFYFAAAALDDVRRTIRGFADNSADRLIDVAKFKELTGVSRKYAIPLLEYFDRVGITRRAGDKRVIQK